MAKVVPPGRLTLTLANEAFFRSGPIRSPDDELCFPALLNCSLFNPPADHPLAWICTQHLDRSFDKEEDLNRRMNGGFKALLPSADIAAIAAQRQLDCCERLAVCQH